MTTQIWLNLPVKNIQQSKEFFSSLGFTFSSKYETPDGAALQIGTKPDIVMLFEENTFKKASQNDLVDTKQGSEILISFDAQSREEVDELAKKVRDAGGNIFSEPQDIQGWMYGFAFADLDGHRWNALYMDMTER